MKRRFLVFFLIMIFFLGACSQIRLNWINYSKKGEPRSPKDVMIFFSKKIIKKEYRVVARYNIDSVNIDPTTGVIKIRRQAAKDGCDAVIIDSVFWTKMTIWSWVYLFIPISQRRGIMTASGIKYISNNNEG